MSEKFRRLNITIPPDLAERVKRLDNVSAICTTALTVACDALETGEPQSLAFGFEYTRRLVVAPAGWEAAP